MVKPSEKVPLTMTRVAEIMAEAGIPSGVFNIVHGTAEGKVIFFKVFIFW